MSVHLAIDDEDIAEFQSAVAAVPAFPNPRLTVSAAAIDERVWVVAAFPEDPGPLETIPLLMLFCETGAPHVPAAVRDAVDEFNTDTASSWRKVRDDVEARAPRMKVS
jgi:hypothetical protein